MTRSGQTIELFLVQAAGWLVGVDPACVERVEKGEAEGPQPPSLADLLGKPAPRETTGAAGRVLLIRDGAEIYRLRVERTLGTEHVEVATLRALPALLRACGVPPWWLGARWARTGLVLLLDLPAAVREHARRISA